MSSTNSNKNNSKSSSENSFDALKDEKTGGQNPSFFNLFEVFMNLNDKHATETEKSKKLTYVERINQLFSEMNNIEGIESLTELHKGTISESIKNLLFEMAKKIDELEKRDEIKSNSMEELQATAEPGISIPGYINVNSKKLGYFFLGENNENGLRLHRTELDKLIVIVKKNFSNEDGEIFSDRSLSDGMIEGSHMPADKKFQK